MRGRRGQRHEIDLTCNDDGGVVASRKGGRDGDLELQYHGVHGGRAVGGGGVHQRAPIVHGGRTCWRQSCASKVGRWTRWCSLGASASVRG